MTLLTKHVLACVGVAIASGLTLTPLPAFAESVPEKETSTRASALGGALKPSNSAVFQIQKDESTAPSITLENKEQALKSGNTPLEWQSEHLDNQRQFNSNFSLINVDFN